MLTNRLGLPQAVVDAVANDPYTRGDSDISVTQLIQPPYQRKLRQEVEIVEDASDKIWSMVGQIGHGILERAYPEAFEDDGRFWIKVKAFLTRLGLWEIVEDAIISRSGYEIPAALTAFETYQKNGVVAEHRLFMPVNGWTVSGQFDVIDHGCLQDYKFTSVWSVIGETKQEWTQQLNLLRLLAIHHGIDVPQLRIIAILRDWTKTKAKIDSQYPQQQVVPVDIDVWPLEYTKTFMLQRVIAHQDANPPPCTDAERWKRDDVWAVMKVNLKRAVKLHDTEQQAKNHVTELGKGHFIQQRPGEYVRCQDYCNVAHRCPQMETAVGF
jgi:hypothetical protein